LLYKVLIEGHSGQIAVASREQASSVEVLGSGIEEAEEEEENEENKESVEQTVEEAAH
jgi:hypothetical protein